MMLRHRRRRLRGRGRVSRYSSPGSPVNTCISTRPGNMAMPLQSWLFIFSGTLAFLPIALIFPFSTTSVPSSSNVLHRVNQTCIGKGYIHCAPPVPLGRLAASASSTAMRTATPISTWSRIRLRSGSSATALSISTPRFIGPGCMTSASGLA